MATDRPPLVHIVPAVVLGAIVTATYITWGWCKDLADDVRQLFEGTGQE